MRNGLSSKVQSRFSQGPWGLIGGQLWAIVGGYLESHQKVNCVFFGNAQNWSSNRTVKICACIEFAFNRFFGLKKTTY